MKDTQTLKGAKTRYGNPISTYDDGYGPLWIHRDSMGISGIVRAREFHDAYSICEDEFFPEARETVEELAAEYATIYMSAREIWNRMNPDRPFYTLPEHERYMINATPGMTVPFTEHWSEHPCFQEAYGFRPNGANRKDVHQHGIYAKDLNGDALDPLTPELIEELGITLDIGHEWEVNVGNVGTVYVGDDEVLARRKYGLYVQLSSDGEGRAAHEPVTLLVDGEPIAEHIPTTQDQ